MKNELLPLNFPELIKQRTDESIDASGYTEQTLYQMKENNVWSDDE